MVAKQNITYQGESITKWINGVVIDGIDLGASDIHFQPQTNVVQVYYRKDGLLVEGATVPISSLDTIVSQLKVLAVLDTTQHNIPQDGHITLEKEFGLSGALDLRISIFPSTLGEVAVLRILNRSDLIFDSVDKIGITPPYYAAVQSVLAQSTGMILVTGPGGSGKTTTLYTMLNALSSKSKNIITLEDPVELRLKGVRQSQINPSIGFTFAAGIKSLLRQDANVVMVGEIRDDETAQISLRAAMMGVLFFSTMHTSNSVGVIVRFLDLGIPRSFITSALKLVISQRLMRVLCDNCKVAAQHDKGSLEEFNLNENDTSQLSQAKGCNTCNGTGYSGRTPIFEIMPVDEAMQHMIIEKATFLEIESHARKQGMQTLREAATAKALSGITTLEEILRVA